MSTSTVHVSTPSRSYDVLIGQGVIDEVGALTRKACGGSAACVIADDNVAPLYANWLQAWNDVIREDGGLPHTAPCPWRAGGGPYWCGFVVQAPWRTYMSYGDKRLIERCYPTMTGWLDYVDAYTVDGGKLGELEYECFNAAAAKIEIAGKSVHPGSAKNQMVNAAALAVELHQMMPAAEVPEHTEGYEGFYFLEEICGDCENACLKYIIRDHDRTKFENRKKTVQNITAYLNEKYGAGTFRLTLRDQYANMAEGMKDHMHLIERAKQVMTDLGVAVTEVPIRGGTDGAALTYMGVPCPNLCTGGYNFHGRYEYASVQEMETCAQMLIRLAEI